MNWTWRYEDEQGAPVSSPLPESFPSQSDAESWLGEHWRELLDSGVQQVVLLDDGTTMYGPMSLKPT
jgi:hypothetical protein